MKAARRAPRTIAGRYVVEHELGRGGMAAVFQVLDRATQRRVALKRLAPGSTATEIALFEREFYTLASLHHPQIVEVFEYGVDERPYYTMELLEGSDLRQRAPMPWPEACACLRQLATILGVLHARRLVHRDISPRNVWCAPGGRIKLIDFGALAPFGATDEIAGTPPLVPPEAVHGQPLDQRSDLYSLGALGYWMLTRTYAYPARTLATLLSAWNVAPTPASRHVEELGSEGLPEIPETLDALLESLLSLDPGLRPTSTAEVIDRIDSIAGFERREQDASSQVYLQSKAFVGRMRECEVVLDLVETSKAGVGGSVLFESPPDLGRTRLLEEVGLRARMAGAAVLHARGGAQHAYGTAEALSLKLLDTAPAEARSAAAGLESVLGHLSRRLHDRLGGNELQLSPMSQASGEGRVRLQAALQDWFFAVSRTRPLVLLVDDLHLVDDTSLAWLTSLVGFARHEHVVIVASLDSEHEGTSSNATIQTFRQYAVRVALEPLGVAETRSLLGSVFGEVLHLSRITDHLHRVSGGSPGYCLELADHLVREEVIRNVDGLWVLPQEIASDQLPKTRFEAIVGRLARVTREARRLGQVLAIQGGTISLLECVAVTELDSRTTFSALESLIREGILMGSADGYRFAHDEVRTALLAELDEQRRKGAHRKLGESILRRDEGSVGTIDRLRAGVHLLRGGEGDRGAAEVSQAGVRLALQDMGEIASALPLLEEALVLLRESGRSSHELVGVLGCLSAAGYFADRRLAKLYGDEAVRRLREVTGVDLALRLRRYLGRFLGLVAALGISAFRFWRLRRNPVVPTFREGMRLLIGCVSALVGTATVCIDPVRGFALAEVLQPLTVLGKNHAVSIFHEFCLGLASTVRDRPGEALRRWYALLERLRSDTPIRGMPDEFKRRVVTGALYACGVLETWRDNSKVLDYAEQLDRFDGKLYSMSADQLRMMYYAHRGEHRLYEHYRERVEMHAIQRGSAWQVETWAPGASISVHQRTSNAMGMKRELAELERLSAELPSLENHVHKARGAHLLLRGLYEEAVPWLENTLREVPLQVIGWARGHGTLARAYNALGRHADARAICLRALETMSDEDRMFPAMNLGVQIEVAMADAGLGDLAGAAQRLDALLVRHAPGRGPLTLGAIHEARARVALLAGDVPTYEEHLAAMGAHFQPTGMPSLLERCRRLERALAGDVVPRRATDHARPADALSTERVSKSESARLSLSLLVEHSRAQEAHLFVRENGSAVPIAATGADEKAELTRWVGERLAEAQETEDMTVLEAVHAVTDSQKITIDGASYHLELLCTSTLDADVVVGAFVVATGEDVRLPGYDVLRAVADHLEQRWLYGRRDRTDRMDTTQEDLPTQVASRDADEKPT